MISYCAGPDSLIITQSFIRFHFLMLISKPNPSLISFWWPLTCYCTSWIYSCHNGGWWPPEVYAFPVLGQMDSLFFNMLLQLESESNPCPIHHHPLVIAIRPLWLYTLVTVLLFPDGWIQHFICPTLCSINQLEFTTYLSAWDGYFLNPVNWAFVITYDRLPV